MGLSHILELKENLGYFSTKSLINRLADAYVKEIKINGYLLEHKDKLFKWLAMAAICEISLFMFSLLEVFRETLS